ncbi:hypothetical protein LY41_000436 [Prauserella halophila]|nr:hypothetical protein [Prauserella halophila]
MAVEVTAARVDDKRIDPDTGTQAVAVGGAPPPRAHRSPTITEDLNARPRVSLHSAQPSRFPATVPILRAHGLAHRPHILDFLFC